MQKSKLIPAEGFSPIEDWKGLPLAVIDFETTGLDPKSDRIVEWGVALFNEGKYEGIFGGLLNPGFEMTDEVIQVHGITNEQVKDCPSFEEMYPKLEKLLKNKIPVAYNAEFDREFLLNEAGRVIRKIVIEQARKAQTVMVTAETIEQSLSPRDLPPAFRANVEWIDPIVWVRHIQKYEKGKKLIDVCKRLGIEIDQAHRAGADAKATGEVLFALERRIDEKQYQLLISRQQELDFEQKTDYKRWKARQR